MANSTPAFSRSGAASAHEELEEVTVCDLGTIDTSATIDLSGAKLFKAGSVSGTITLTLSGLAVGASARLHLKAAATAPTVTFAGVDAWLGTVGAPTFSNSKVTVIEVWNDGTRVVGTAVEEYPAT